jgi:DNA (cytosine-5)-methyltransferase 1
MSDVGSGPVLRYGSACSGIEAASEAWRHLGWEPVFFSEIEAFPRAVLAERWPGVPIHGDFTTIREGDYEPIDLLVCGTPCQDFSVAGLRAGLAGERGFLTIEFVRLAERLRPRWLVWENVPGVLSSDDGRAFGLFLGALGECGYGTAWRVLDAQHFGVPQRRRRVFVVGYLGDWRPPAAVLFERESLRGDTAPRRAAGEGTTATATGGAPSGFNNTGQGWWNDADVATTLRDMSAGSASKEATLVANPLGAKAGWRGDLDNDNDTYVTHTLRAEGFDASEDGAGRGVPLTLAFDPRQIGHPANHSNPKPGDPCHPLRGVANAEPAVLTLAIRGRGDSHDLEYRQDGIANAILTPNGGRAGIGVGAVAVPIQSVQSVREKKQNGIGIGADGDEMFTLTKRDQHAVAFHQNVRSEVRITEVMGALNTGGGKPGQGYPAVAFRTNQTGAQGPVHSVELTDTLAQDHPPAVGSGMSVRRLTPVECERLQGFPDDYTLITYRKKPAADGPRYRALGNSMAVPCMKWLGERIAMVEELL